MTSFPVEGHRPSRGAQELTVTTSFADKEAVAPGEPIELTLNRPLDAAEGRLAVLVGTSDLTGLFTAKGLSLTYGAGALPLPAGKTEMTVYLVAPDGEWKQVAQFPLRVAAQSTTRQTTPEEAQPDQPATTPAADTPQGATEPARRFLGFDKFVVVPSLNIGLKSQFAEIHSPDANRPARPQFTDGQYKAV